MLTRAEAIDAAGITNPDLLAVHRRMVPFLDVIAVSHLGYDEAVHKGQLVVHEGMRDRFRALFAGLLDLRYPVQQVRPAVVYGWNDKHSMAANNTTVYRPDFIGDPARGVASEHTRGSAIDLNPLDNPLLTYENNVEPAEAIGRTPHAAAVLMGNQEVIALASELGLEWGGYWPITGTPDYYGPEIPLDRHHFELRPQLVGSLAVPAGIWPPAPE